MTLSRVHRGAALSLACSVVLATGPALAGTRGAVALVVDTVEPESAAARAGIGVGDVVVALDGRTFESWGGMWLYRLQREGRHPVRVTRRGLFRHQQLTIDAAPWGMEWRPRYTGSVAKLRARAMALIEEGEIEQGVAEAGRAARILRAEERPLAAAWLTHGVARALVVAGESTRARALFAASAEEIAGAGDRLLEAVLLTEAADSLEDVDADEPALELFQEAVLLLRRHAPASVFLARVLLMRANLLRWTNTLDEAETLYHEALSLWQEIDPESDDRGVVIADLGAALHKAFRYEEARERFLEALAILREGRPRSIPMARLLGNLGMLDADEGKLQQAERRYREALALYREIEPNGNGTTWILGAMASLAWRTGDLETSRDLQLECLDIQEAHDPRGRATADAYNGLGIVAHFQGDLEVAREYYAKALDIFRELGGETVETAWCLNNLGAVSWQAGDLDVAEAYQLEALRIREKIAPDSFDLAASLANLGDIALSRGDLERARDFFQRDLKLVERLAPGSLDLAISYESLGKVDLQEGSYSSAAAHLARALSIVENLAPGSRQEADVLFRLGLVEELQSRPQAAAGFYERAIAASESQRSRIGGARGRGTYFSFNMHYYSAAVRALVKLGRPDTAFEVFERSRARGLLDLLSERRIDFSRDVPRALLEEERALAQRRRDLSERVAMATAETPDDEVEALHGEYHLLSLREDALAEKIRQSSTRYASLVRPDVLDFEGVLASLDPGTLLLAYAVDTSDSVPPRLYLLSLLRGEEGALACDARPLEVDVGNLKHRVERFRTALIQDRGDRWQRHAQRLYSDLLAPVEEELARAERLLVVPDGHLHALPFTALFPADGEPALGLRLPITTVLSVTLYRELKARQGAATADPDDPLFVGFGDPRYRVRPLPGSADEEASSPVSQGLSALPATRDEVIAIQRLFGERAIVYLGPEASEKNLRSLPNAPRYLHLACHGLIDEHFPMRSTLALSAGEHTGDDATDDDGRVQAWEILQDLRLSADMVVLSACGTGLGRLQAGEGMIGLARAFFYAGTSSLVVSLWPVADSSTRLFMEAFYRDLAAGVPKDEALRRARVALEGRAEYAHPFFWAAFTLQGAP